MRSGWNSFVCVVALVLGALGCGPPELTVDPGTSSVVAGSEAISFTASGGSGEYTWALVPSSGLGTLSATEGTTVTLTPAATVGAASTGVLTVTSGEDSVSVEVTVTPRAIAGRVITIGQVPLSGAVVALAGADGTFTTTSSDAEGRFAFPSVPPRYDVVTIHPASRTYTFHKGLTRLDPVLITSGPDATDGAFTADIAGTVSGGAYPSPPSSHVTRMTFGCPGIIVASYPQSTASSTGEYTQGDIPWAGVASVSGTMHALQVIQDGAGRATGYAGYGKLEGVGLSNGANLTGRNITLTTPPASVNMTGTLVLPAGATIAQKNVFIHYGPNAIGKVLDNTVDTSLDVPLPEIPGATVMAIALLDTAFGQTAALRTGIPLNATGVTLSPPPAPQVLTPASGATGVNGSTPFSWSPVPGATFMSLFEPTSAGQPTITVVSSEPQLTLPNLAALGGTLPAAAGYTWTLLTLHGLPTVDEFANGGYTAFIYKGIADQSAREVGFSQRSAGFTTAP